MDRNSRNGGKNATKFNSDPTIEVIFFNLLFIILVLFIIYYIFNLGNGCVQRFKG
jgi:ABC-type amino acid transport system permease subunit